MDRKPAYLRQGSVVSGGIVSDLTGTPTGPLLLANKLIVVTGGRGLLGSVWCRALAWQGAKVLSLDVTAPTTGMRGDYRDSGGPARGVVIQRLADTTVKESLSLVVQEFGPPHGLVCAAGIDAKPETDGSDPWRDWGRILNVNLTGTALACEVFGGAMAKSTRGSVVVVSSLYGVVAPDQRSYRGRCDGLCLATILGSPEIVHRADCDESTVNFTKPAAYSASKAGVLGLTKYLAALWGPSNVRVNALVPGGVQTESSPVAFVGQYARKVPLGRMATPTDCVGALIYLLSDASEYVSGTTVTVDGGYLAL